MDEQLYLDDDFLEHYGVKRRSGRFPYGSGDMPFQHESWFLNRADELRKKGYSNKQIAEDMGISMDMFNKRNMIERSERKRAEISFALRQKEEGYTNDAIGKMLGGKGESYVRTLLEPATAEKNKVIYAVKDAIEGEVKKKRFVDIGESTEINLNVARSKMDAAVEMLKDEGYQTYTPKVKQLGTGKNTTFMVLGDKDTTYAELMKDIGQVKPLHDITLDDGNDGPVLRKTQFPQVIDSSRVFIKYNEDGGAEKDGVIELRRGVPDLDLGKSNYAQVRIAVDGDRYMKGMAVYSDDVPKGYDIILNSNKSRADGPNKAFKKMERDEDGNVDQERPFGASIMANGQSMYIGKDGKEHLSAINKVNDEGTWSGWANNTNLASQFLAKQPTKLVENQLRLSIAQKQRELDEIQQYTNPEIRKKSLLDFAEECDASAVDLKAAGLPRQKTCAILPVTTLKDNEIYATNFKDGEEVILIRYPHQGTFEIPVLRVNNTNKEGRKMMGTSPIDAVGINSHVAHQLSGADYDGDNVLVIPTKGITFKTKKQEGVFSELKDYEPKELYKMSDEEIAANPKKVISGVMKQKQMGICTNLLTDMTIKGASDEEIVRAVKCAQMIIDAEKHKLDWKQCYRDNNIAELKKIYQTDPNNPSKHGASTLLSRSKNEYDVPERSWYKIDPETGEKIWKETGRHYTDKKGKVVYNRTKSSQMAETDDAYKLSTGSKVENLYAEYANTLKRMGNQARLESLKTPSLKRSPSAAQTYSKEVESLNDKVKLAMLNAPLERRAQAIANSITKAQFKDNPAKKEDRDWRKKIENAALAEGRAITGASKRARLVHLTDREWEAIQAGAIGSTMMQKIISNMDSTELKQMATPKENTTTKYISTNKNNISLAKAMLSSGYTQSEVAERLGCSASLVNKMVHDETD